MSYNLDATRRALMGLTPPPREPTMKTGIELIAAERERQITAEGWTAEHDDQYTEAELERAALCYLDVASSQVVVGGKGETYGPPDEWPWRMGWWKPADDPLRNMAKSGALIAAAMDRLQRIRANALPNDGTAKSALADLSYAPSEEDTGEDGPLTTTPQTATDGVSTTDAEGWMHRCKMVGRELAEAIAQKESFQQEAIALMNDLAEAREGFRYRGMVLQSCLDVWTRGAPLKETVQLVKHALQIEKLPIEDDHDPRWEDSRDCAEDPPYDDSLQNRTL